MLNKTLVVIVCLFSMLSMSAQTELSWTNLMDITFKDVYLESDDMYVYYPLFKEKQKSLDGQEVAITGYIIPVDVELTNTFCLHFPSARVSFAETQALNQ